MISIKKILTVAVFEAKTLFRSWFFRIFSVLALFILVIMDIALFALPQSSWMNRGLEASIPYMNLVLLNVVQAIIAVFMASEFLKYDYKLDTTEAIYARSMTNADYVLGKTFGVLMVFIVLNILVLLISFIFNFFFTEIPVLPAVYLYYPLLISLPTLIFIFGLSFVFMVTIRNQAVTFIIILGYIASTLFFLSGRFHHIFDYMSNTVPLMYSGIVGFGDISTILIHRGIYLSLGIGFIFASVVLMKRLSQSRAMTQVSLVSSILFICCGFYLGYIYIQRLSDGVKLRENMRALNSRIIKNPSISMSACALSLAHLGKEIEANAALTFINKTEGPISEYQFSLNPDLKVLSVNRGGQDLQYDRTLHIITIKPASPLAPGALDSLTISYRGKINEDAAYSEIDENTREAGYRFWVYNIDKRYGFFTPSYVLLTAENLWYPVAGVPYGSGYPILKGKDFVKFTLRVKTVPGLTVISQGKESKPAPGVFEFKPEAALSQISLVIGNYEKRSVTAQGIEYNLYIAPGHDYFSQYFKALKTKLPELIDANMTDFERKLDISYPFARLSLVEVPIQFYAYPRIWSTAQETVQPEQVFIPEKGVTLRAADFKRSSYFMKQGGGRGGGGGGGMGGGGGGGGRGGGSGQTMTDEENQSNLFNRFIQTTFAGSGPDNRMMRQVISQFTSGRNLDLQRMAFSAGMGLVNAPDYGLFPEFYSYANHFHSEEWPILNMAIENYFKARTSQSSSGFRSFMGGASTDDNANTALQKQNLKEILADPTKKDIVQDVLSSKSSYLFSLLESRAGKEGFNAFLSDFLYKNQFRDAETEELLKALDEKFKFELKPYLDAWYNQKGLPAFIVGEMKCYEVIESSMTRYQVIFSVSNPEPAEGLMSVSFMVGGQRGDRQQMMGIGGGASSNPTSFIDLKGKETKEIGILLDSAPRMATIKTFISQNLPSSFSRNFGKPEKNPNIIPYEGAKILDKPLSFAETGEIIVDDEDPGFQTVSLEKESFLKRLLVRNKDDEKGYAPMRFFRPPLNWRHTVQGEYYGLYKHTAYYIKSGDGKKKAIWKTQIPETGNYSVYMYNSPSRGGMMQRGGGRVVVVGGGGGGRQQQQQKPSDTTEYHYFVHHDDGVDEIEFEGSQSPEGWNLLGTFHITAGQTEVELTNKSKGPVVVADAVKWVKQGG